MKDIFTPADILLPAEGVDLARWTVIACDQYSADLPYWEALEAYVGEAPSALRLMLPEAYLHAPDLARRQEAMPETMRRYLREKVFRTVEDSYVYIERTLPNGKLRRGLLGKLDLEAYDWSAGSQSPVRSTEATVAERLPVRVALRRALPLEMPHIVLFADDPEDTLFSAVTPGEVLYDFDLYGDSGHLRGLRVNGPAADRVRAALNALEGNPVFAMGDGNHSLAAAKNRWEELKAAGAPMDHPARWALAEVENVRDDAVEFFPIHRVLYDTDEGGFIKQLQGPDTGALVAEADDFCREYIAAHGGHVDYIHGDEAARADAQKPGGAALLLPTLPKAELFPHIASSGNYPKKSFSVGHAADKRWYLECRKIIP